MELRIKEGELSLDWFQVSMEPSLNLRCRSFGFKGVIGTIGRDSSCLNGISCCLDSGAVSTCLVSSGSEVSSGNGAILENPGAFLNLSVFGSTLGSGCAEFLPEPIFRKKSSKMRVLPIRWTAKLSGSLENGILKSVLMCRPEAIMSSCGNKWEYFMA